MSPEIPDSNPHCGVFFSIVQNTSQGRFEPGISGIRKKTSVDATWPPGQYLSATAELGSLVWTLNIMDLLPRSWTVAILENCHGRHQEFFRGVRLLIEGGLGPSPGKFWKIGSRTAHLRASELYNSIKKGVRSNHRTPLLTPMIAAITVCKISHTSIRKCRMVSLSCSTTMLFYVTGVPP